VQHFIPTMGLRIDFPKNKTRLAYSCDTEPCAQVIRLAEGADILIHEASGLTPGHSSAAQAGEIATLAEVGRLYLIHYPTGAFAGGDLVADASTTYKGEVRLAEDLAYIELG
jgi:ribonuclease Z